MPERHIFTEDNTRNFAHGDDENNLNNLDMTKIDPNLLKGFLQNGQMEELKFIPVQT